MERETKSKVIKPKIREKYLKESQSKSAINSDI